jgi:hypothetical protein
MSLAGSIDDEIFALVARRGPARGGMPHEIAPVKRAPRRAGTTS